MAGKTEPMENLKNWTNRKVAQPLCTFKCRKIIMCECLCINVLSIETPSYLNVETEPRTNFLFFHNGQCRYSISVDTRKTGDPNFGRMGGSVIWNFSVQHIFTKWEPFFNLFIMAGTDSLFPLTLWKTRYPNSGGGGVGNLKFLCTMHIYKMAGICS